MLLFCGETGIRTPETLLEFTRFPGVPLQPLEHLSKAPMRIFGYKGTAFFLNTQTKLRFFLIFYALQPKKLLCVACCDVNYGLWSGTIELC